MLLVLAETEHFSYAIPNPLHRLAEQYFRESDYLGCCASFGILGSIAKFAMSFDDIEPLGNPAANCAA